MKYNYTALYNKNAELLNKKPQIKKAVSLYNKYTPYFFALAYALLWIYGAWKGKFAPMDFIKIFCAPAFALLTVSVMRLAISRPRPYEEEGAGIIPLEKKSSAGNSFPSRHLASASVIAVTFFPYLPAVGVLLAFLALGLGYTRFALGWHYPVDIAVGFLLGLAIGLLPILL